MRALACIHPAQGGVTCRDPSTPCGLRRGKRIGRGYPHGLRRGLEKVNAAGRLKASAPFGAMREFPRAAPLRLYLSRLVGDNLFQPRS